jgi:hypothetical protein
LFEAIAFAVQFQDMDMMREAVEQRSCEAAAEDSCPFLKKRRLELTIVEQSFATREFENERLVRLAGWDWSALFLDFDSAALMRLPGLLR